MNKTYKNFYIHKLKSRPKKKKNIHNNKLFKLFTI